MRATCSTERFSRAEGKTTAFVDGEVQKLLVVIEITTHTGLRDRALLGAFAYTFARIGAVVNLKVEDYYPSDGIVVEANIILLTILTDAKEEQ